MRSNYKIWTLTLIGHNAKIFLEQPIAQLQMQGFAHAVHKFSCGIFFRMMEKYGANVWAVMPPCIIDAANGKNGT